MALILAVNPGNRHSPTLARLARELRGCELMGAESCPVAIKAIKKRVPDVLLLPAVPANGEADLMAHLKSIPGGVLTLKMPPVESADPVDLARQIRELLTGVPASRLRHLLLLKRRNAAAHQHLRQLRRRHHQRQQGHRRNCSPRQRPLSRGFAPARRNGPSR